MLNKQVFEILFNYGQEDECLFEVSVGWDSFRGHLEIYYVYDLEAGQYEEVDFWTDAAWSRFRNEVIAKLRSKRLITDCGYHN